MPRYAKAFDHHFRGWVAAVCDAWEYGRPDEAFYANVRTRLTDPVVEWIGYGIDNASIIERGFLFNVADNAPGKGPYRWFSRRTGATEPQCNWEYYVQAALFARLWEPCRKASLRLTFEDALMDITIRSQGELLWCVEVKEREPQLAKLLNALVAHGVSVDLDAPDRGNDPLRKAKYLIRHKPEFFSAVAIGSERHFKVVYPRQQAFQLIDASPPVVASAVLPARHE
jgi:hypothetical protein